MNDAAKELLRLIAESEDTERFYYRGQIILRRYRLTSDERGKRVMEPDDIDVEGLILDALK